jgi:hypothetical protein
MLDWHFGILNRFSRHIHLLCNIQIINNKLLKDYHELWISLMIICWLITHSIHNTIQKPQNVLYNHVKILFFIKIASVFRRSIFIWYVFLNSCSLEDLYTPARRESGIYRDIHVRSFVRPSHFWLPDNN